MAYLLFSDFIYKKRFKFHFMFVVVTTKSRSQTHCDDLIFTANENQLHFSVVRTTITGDEWREVAGSCTIKQLQ